MTRREQRQFVKELIANVQRDILSRLPMVPAEWDGFELRQLIADHYAQAAFQLDRGRKRAYKNAVIVNNLT